MKTTTMLALALSLAAPALAGRGMGWGRDGAYARHSTRRPWRPCPER